jgi:hypothetical protein
MTTTRSTDQFVPYVEHPDQLGPVGRWLCWLVAVALMAPFAVACVLKPDARGFGTHQQLGLPPCTFQFLWEIPCPGCGMTTSYACLVRGQWGAALTANPAGALLAVGSLLVIPWCIYVAITGRWSPRIEPLLAASLGLSGVSLVAILVWLVRIIPALWRA